MADNRGLGTERLGAKQRQRLLGAVRGDDGDQLALVGHVERVEA